MILTTTFNKIQSDTLGALASGICLVHCVATPFLFMSAAAIEHLHDHGHEPHGTGPFWWSMIDIVFIIISLMAVVRSARLTSKKWIKYALYASWIFLTVVLLNEKLGIVHLVEEIIYVPAVALIGLHLYNRKYCQCEGDTCCAH